MRNFGYKICYKERGSKKYIRYFMTYTYPQDTVGREDFFE